MSLTWAKVKALRKPGTYSDERGLYLQISGAGGKSWVLRFQLNGRRREMGLGSIEVVSLATARDLAQDARSLLVKGVDPIQHREAARASQRVAEKQAVTFKQAAETYIESNAAGWRNGKHQKQWRSTLEAHAFPVLGKSPVAAIDTALVLKVLEPIWHRLPTTASRVRGRIETVLAAATARGQRSGPNPAQWRNHLDQLLPARSRIRRVEHHAALPYAELPALMTELRHIESVSARALEFCVLTASRTEEVRGAIWSELDLEAALWVIPGARMKGGRQHRVPLAGAAMAIVERMAETRLSSYVFPGWRHLQPLSHTAMLECLQGLRPGISVHGMRSTFKDWCSECTAFPDFLSEMALAHISGDKVRAAYARADLMQKRRELMRDWANFCSG